MGKRGEVDQSISIDVDAREPGSCVRFPPPPPPPPRLAATRNGRSIHGDDESSGGRTTKEEGRRVEKEEKYEERIAKQIGTASDGLKGEIDV